MSRFVVVDFETSGIGINKTNKYKEYDADKMPLPRENYPVQIAAVLIENNEIVKEVVMFIKGVERFDPWVLEHAPHLSIETCNEIGVSFEHVLVQLANLIDDNTIFVAHNVHYDYDEVLLYTCNEMKRNGTFTKASQDAFSVLQKCAKLCTCLNPYTKTTTEHGKTHAYYYEKANKWIGPSLKQLACFYDISYDANLAHDAMYDALLTSKCLIEMCKQGIIQYGNITENNHKREREDVYIYVPYKDKVEAKKYGARWNPDKKSWYIPEHIDVQHFKKWMQADSRVKKKSALK